jgi:Hint module
MSDSPFRSPSAPRRSRWRFGLRSLFAGMTLVAAWLGWESHTVRQRRATLDEFRGKSAFQVDFSPDPVFSPIRRWMGDRAVKSVWYRSYVADYAEADLRRLQRAFPEAQFSEIFPEPCHPGCFPAGTLVETPAGPRRIETIRPGDFVLSVAQSGETLALRVQSRFVTENQIWRVETDDGVLFTTQTQPLCLAAGAQSPRPEQRTAQVGQINRGDQVLAWRDGQAIPTAVRSVAPTQRHENVYNLILGDSRAFVAGGFLARSKPPAPSDRPTL